MKGMERILSRMHMHIHFHTKSASIIALFTIFAITGITETETSMLTEEYSFRLFVNIMLRLRNK